MKSLKSYIKQNSKSMLKCHYHTDIKRLYDIIDLFSEENWKNGKEHDIRCGRIEILLSERH